jgi:hypothetical protein
MHNLRRPILILVLFVVVVCAGWYLTLWTMNNGRARRAISRGVYVTISKETTIVTEPLRSDGYVNYLAALNLRASEGVTLDNNAAVLFWQAIGPKKIHSDMRTRFFQMLKMTPPSVRGDYFVSLEDYAEQRRDVGNADMPACVSDQLAITTQRPWSKEEFPLVAAALAVNENPLALLVKASKRARCYHPLLADDSNEGRLLDTNVWYQELTHHVGDALVSRAMFRLQQGASDKCWEDLLACHRLARLTGQGPFLLDGLVALSIDKCARAGDRALLAHARLTAAQAAKMREDLARLPPLPDFVDKINVGERFTFVDLLSAAAHDGFDPSIDRHSQYMADACAKNTASASLDWDLMFRMGNSWYNRVVAAGSKPIRRERLAELSKLEQEVIELSKTHYDWKSNLAATLFDKWSEKTANMTICNFAPATSVLETEDLGKMEAELIQLGFALAEYRADHSAYPRQLTELSPHYVALLPIDVFANGAAVHYRRQGDGYVLYSVGWNGRDDGGHDREEGQKAGEDWDDLSIKVPK